MSESIEIINLSLTGYLTEGEKYVTVNVALNLYDA